MAEPPLPDSQIEMVNVEPSLNPQLENRLLRYLHTGMEVPKYFPGCWESHKYYDIDKLSAVKEALEENKNNVKIVTIIQKAYDDGWYTRFETIAFALTKCLLLGGPAVKEATYKAVIKICNTPEHLMLFAKFTRHFKSGSGQGWCKSVRNWYTTTDPMELAKEVTRVRARHGRSHKTLIRKSHLKVMDTDVERNAVVKYVIFGLKHVKQLYAHKNETKAILEYIQKVEDMRHCEDPAAAATIAEQNKFTLDHVPGHLLTAQEVWDVVLQQFTLEQILNNLQRIHNMGFLTMNSTTTAIILSLLNNKDFVKKSKITPIAVYITLCNYNKKCRPMTYEKAKVAAEKQLRRRSRQIFDNNTGTWEWTVSRRHPREIKVWGIEHPPNAAIVAALGKLLDDSWLLTPATGAKYMITLDMRHHMFKGRHFCKNYSVPKKSKKTKVAAPAPAAGASGDTNENTEKKNKKHLLAECFYNRHVTPGRAAIILALQILKREKNVKLAVFSDDGVQIVSMETNFSSVEEAEYVLRNANLGKVQQDAPIEWAMKNKVPIDVFINMIDRSTRYMELDLSERGGRGPGGRYGPPPAVEKKIVDHCPVRALQRYREAKCLPNSKLIVMSLASHRISTTDGSHEGVLDIIGIDEHVPKVMDAFVMGQFK